MLGRPEPAHHAVHLLDLFQVLGEAGVSGFSVSISRFLDMPTTISSRREVELVLLQFCPHLLSISV